MVGIDEGAKRLRLLLSEHGVNAVLSEHASFQSIVKLRLIGRNQQLLRVDFEQAPDHEVLVQILSDLEHELARHDVVLCSDYGKKGAHIPSMIKLARAAGKMVLVDPRGSDYGRYAGASVITPNRSELMQVVGHWLSESDLEL